MRTGVTPEVTTLVGKKYRPPTISIDVSLDEFEDNEIADYLRSRGYDVANYGEFSDGCGGSDDGVFISHFDTVRISRLFMCGQCDSAIAELVQVFNESASKVL